MKSSPSHAVIYWSSASPVGIAKPISAPEVSSAAHKLAQAGAGKHLAPDDAAVYARAIEQQMLFGAYYSRVVNASGHCHHLASVRIQTH